MQQYGSTKCGLHEQLLIVHRIYLHKHERICSAVGVAFTACFYSVLLLLLLLRCCVEGDFVILWCASSYHTVCRYRILIEAAAVA